jgi:hypothetical protein
MDQKRRQLLLKTLRGNNFRRALKAIAELRASSDTATASAVVQAAPDEQREFQARCLGSMFSESRHADAKLMCATAASLLANCANSYLSVRNSKRFCRTWQGTSDGKNCKS